MRRRLAIGLSCFLALAVSPAAYAAPPPIGSTNVVLSPSPNPVDPGGRVTLEAESPVARTDTSSSSMTQIIDRTKLRLTGIDDVIAPEGWTIYYSTDGGTNFTAVPADPTTVPWSSVNAIKATGAVKSNGATPEGDQVTKGTQSGSPNTPIPASIDTSGAGDGFMAFFDPAHTLIFNVPHHQQPSTATVDCHLLTTGARCTGFPKSLGVSSSNLSTGRVVGSRLWTVGTRVKPGQANNVGQMVFRCLDIAAVIAGTGGPVDCSTPYVIVDDTITGTAFTPAVDFSAVAYIPNTSTVQTSPYNWTIGPEGAGFQGSTAETKLYAYNVLKGTLACVDTATMAPCTTSPGYSLGLTPASDISTFGNGYAVANGDQSIAVWGGRIYVKAQMGGTGANQAVANTSYRLTCVLASSPSTKCPGFATPLTFANGIGWGKLVELPNADGTTKGMCVLGATVKCFDANGVAFSGPPTLVNSSYGSNNNPTWDTLANGWVTYPVRWGTRIYYSDGDGSNATTTPYNSWTYDGAKLFCWDAARAASASTPDAAGCMGPTLTPAATWAWPQSNPNGNYTNYTVVPDPALPDCLWVVRDGQPSIYSLNARTGKSGNCGALDQDFGFGPSPIVPRMGCNIDPNQPAIRAWNSFTLSTPAKSTTTPPNYQSASLTIKDSSGVPIPGWTDLPITAGIPLSMSTLPVSITGQKPSFKVKFASPSGVITGAVAEVQAIGDSPQLCLRPVAINDCPSSPPGPYTPAKLVPLTAAVTAKGSSTLTNSTTVTFTDANQNVTINPLPLEKCAAPISGVAKESTGLLRSVAGVTVTLLTSTGAAVTYPADWPVVALRGQPVTATTDANGAYAFPPIGFGSYKVSFSEPASYTVTSATTIGNSVTGTVPGTVTAPGSATSVTSNVIAVGPLTAGGVGVAGVVNATYGVPITAVADTSIGGMNKTQSATVLANDGPSTGATWAANPLSLCDPNTTPPQTPLPTGTGCTQTTVSIAGQGTYTVTGTGATAKIVFTPCTATTAPAAACTTPFTGTATPLRYQATDSAGQSTSATYTPTVMPPPVAVDDTTSGAWNATQTVNPLANDTVGSIGTVSSSLVASSVRICPSVPNGGSPITGADCTGTSSVTTADGTYAVNPTTGAITFTPNAGFTGLVTQPLQYTVSDSLGQTTSALYWPTVTPPPGPAATPQTKQVTAGQSVSFTTITGTGGLATPGGPALTPSLTCLITPGSSPATCDADGIVTIAGEGTYTLNRSTGVVTFAADVNAPGGALTPIAYRVTDSLGVTATSTLTPYVPVPPRVQNDLSTGPWDTNQIITPLANDTAGTAPINAASLKLCAVSPSLQTPPNCTATSVTIANEGTYTLAADGTVTFDPLPTFSGVATPVTYVVADTDGRVSSATITPAVTPPAAPIANDATEPVGPGHPAVFAPLTGVGGLTTISGPPLDASKTLLCGVSPVQTPPNCDKTSLTVTGGTYSLVNGVVTFTLATGFTGAPDPISYQVVDTLGHFDAGTLTPFQPDPPVAAADASVGEQGAVQTASLLGNDTPDSRAALVPSTLTICSGAGPCSSSADIVVANEGTYHVNTTTGLVTFTPLSTFTGQASGISYTITDVLGRSVTSTYTPTVLAKPAPILLPDAATGSYGSPIVFTPLTGTNASGPDSPGTIPAPVTVNGVTTTYGNLALTTSTILLCGPAEMPPDCTQTQVATIDGTYVADPATGTVTFTGSPSFTGTATQPVTYQVANKYTKTETQAATTVDPQNPAIAKINDSAGRTPGSTGYVNTWPVPQGGTGNTTSAVITTGTPRIGSTTITPTITAPTAAARPDTQSTPWDSAVTVNVMANDTYVGSPGATSASLMLCGPSQAAPNCTMSSVTIPGKGTYELVIVNGMQEIRFTPQPGFTGAVDAVPYAFVDDRGTVLSSTLAITVTPPDPPTAIAQSRQVMPGASVTFTSLADGAGLVARGDTAIASTCLLAPGSSPAACDADGIVTIAGEGTYVLDVVTGVVTFTAVPGAPSGGLTPVGYRVTDSFGLTASSTLTPIVPARPTLAPLAKTDLVNTPQAFDVLANATHATGATIAASSVKLCGAGESAPSGCTQTSVDVLVDGRAAGTYSVNATTGVVTFTPVDGFTGNAPSVYVAITDSLGQQAFATISPTVTPLPTPVAPSQTLSGAPGEVLTFTAPASASPIVPGTPAAASVSNLVLNPTSLKLCGPTEVPKPDGFGCTLTQVTTVDGTYLVGAGGAVVFTPAPGFLGTATTPVTYQVANQFDVNGVPSQSPGFASALLTPRINPPAVPVTVPPDVPPTPGDMAVGTRRNTPVTGSLVASAQAPVGSVFSLLTPPTHGTATVLADGGFTYVPARNFVGDDSFGYQVCTPGGSCASAQVHVTVAPEDGLLAMPVVKTVPRGSLAPLNFVPRVKPPVSSLRVAAVGSSRWGTTITMPGKGVWRVTGTTVRFTPVKGFTGRATIRYRVVDGRGRAATSTFTAYGLQVPSSIAAGL